MPKKEQEHPIFTLIQNASAAVNKEPVLNQIGATTLTITFDKKGKLALSPLDKKDGGTPLHAAVRTGNPEIVEAVLALYKQCAEAKDQNNSQAIFTQMISCKGRKSGSAYEKAVEYRKNDRDGHFVYRDIVALLENHGADTNRRKIVERDIKYYERDLYIELEKAEPNMEEVKRLLRYVPLNIKNKNQESPLHVLIRKAKSTEDLQKVDELLAEHKKVVAEYVFAQHGEGSLVGNLDKQAKELLKQQESLKKLAPEVQKSQLKEYKVELDRVNTELLAAYHLEEDFLNGREAVNGFRIKKPEDINSKEAKAARENLARKVDFLRQKWEEADQKVKQHNPEYIRKTLADVQHKKSAYYSEREGAIKKEVESIVNSFNHKGHTPLAALQLKRRDLRREASAVRVEFEKLDKNNTEIGLSICNKIHALVDTSKDNYDKSFELFKNKPFTNLTFTEVKELINSHEKIKNDPFLRKKIAEFEKIYEPYLESKKEKEKLKEAHDRCLNSMEALCKSGADPYASKGRDVPVRLSMIHNSAMGLTEYILENTKIPSIARMAIRAAENITATELRKIHIDEEAVLAMTGIRDQVAKDAQHITSELKKEFQSTFYQKGKNLTPKGRELAKEFGFQKVIAQNEMRTSREAGQEIVSDFLPHSMEGSKWDEATRASEKKYYTYPRIATRAVEQRLKLETDKVKLELLGELIKTPEAQRILNPKALRHSHSVNEIPLTEYEKSQKEQSKSVAKNTKKEGEKELLDQIISEATKEIEAAEIPQDALKIIESYEDKKTLVYEEIRKARISDTKGLEALKEQVKALDKKIEELKVETMKKFGSAELTGGIVSGFKEEKKEEIKLEKKVPSKLKEKSQSLPQMWNAGKAKTAEKPKYSDKVTLTRTKAEELRKRLDEIEGKQDTEKKEQPTATSSLVDTSKPILAETKGEVSEKKRENGRKIVRAQRTTSTSKENAAKKDRPTSMEIESKESFTLTVENQTQVKRKASEDKRQLEEQKRQRVKEEEKPVISQEKKETLTTSTVVIPKEKITPQQTSLKEPGNTTEKRLSVRDLAKKINDQNQDPEVANNAKRTVKGTEGSAITTNTKRDTSEVKPHILPSTAENIEKKTLAVEAKLITIQSRSTTALGGATPTPLVNNPVNRPPVTQQKKPGSELSEKASTLRKIGGIAASKPQEEKKNTGGMDTELQKILEARRKKTDQGIAPKQLDEAVKNAMENTKGIKHEPLGKTTSPHQPNNKFRTRLDTSKKGPPSTPVF